jgi:hypothetical protein
MKERNSVVRILQTRGNSFVKKPLNFGSIETENYHSHSLPQGMTGSA